MTDTNPADVTPPQSRLGALLVRLRERHGRTDRATAAARAGLGEERLARYERGTELPDPDDLVRLLASYGQGLGVLGEIATQLEPPEIRLLVREEVLRRNRRSGSGGEGLLGGNDRGPEPPLDDPA